MKLQVSTLSSFTYFFFNHECLQFSTLSCSGSLNLALGHSLQLVVIICMCASVQGFEAEFKDQFPIWGRGHTREYRREIRKRKSYSLNWYPFPLDYTSGTVCYVKYSLLNPLGPQLQSAWILLFYQSSAIVQCNN